jgi:hypothetical protein
MPGANSRFHSLEEDEVEVETAPNLPRPFALEEAFFL